jgi:hypothetical protein
MYIYIMVARLLGGLLLPVVAIVALYLRADTPDLNLTKAREREEGEEGGLGWNPNPNAPNAPNANTVNGEPNANTVNGEPNANTVNGEPNANTVNGEQRPQRPQRPRQLTDRSRTGSTEFESGDGEIEDNEATSAAAAVVWWQTSTKPVVEPTVARSTSPSARRNYS